MQLIYRSFEHAAFGEEQILDADVCTCCQTSASRVGDDLLVAYRDHFEGEVRDISLVRRENGRWTDPFPLSEDGWVYPGCPVNGPAMDSDGDLVAVAWFTAADEEPRVLARLSVDGGKHFGEILRIDAGNPIGRVDLVITDERGVFVTWLEQDGRDAELRLRGIRDDEVLDAGATLGRTRAARSSGFPRMAAGDGRLYVAWTEPGPPSRIRLVRVTP